LKNKVLLLLLFFIPLVLLTGCSKEEKKIAISVYQSHKTSMRTRTSERYFEVYQEEQWNKFFIKGINIGTSTPGKWYTQFPADRALYRSWLEDIAAMNINTIRMYTLLDPAFYQVLLEFNEDPSTPTIWLMQEIWPDDEVPDLNFNHTSYKMSYKKEVQLVIDALHGNAEIPGRPYRAYGHYSADVSPYILGILIGREFEPEEVKSTDANNPPSIEYLGHYVTIKNATPTEAWLAELTDFTMSYTQEKYNWQYPVGFVSWPTLDPLSHPTEHETSEISASPAYNDRETVHPDRFRKGKENLAGFFGAYHIYPNYPDFMNNEPHLSNYSDNHGSFRYLGYLHQFMEIHPPYPAVVAEFGISTSLNTAHINPDGLNHGGLSEDSQATKTIRMMNTIKNEGYAGGILFEWTDEWAKKTWNTEPYMVPWERKVLWKNAMDPEQNYGILSAESDHIPFGTDSSHIEDYDVKSRTPNKTMIKSLEKSADVSFLYLALELENMPLLSRGQIAWDDVNIAIGIDTALRESGEFKMPFKGLPDLPSGIEFLLKIQSPNDASLLVIPSYNRGHYKFSITRSHTAEFERIISVANRERVTLDKRVFPELLSDESVLTYGSFHSEDTEYNSLAHWYADPDAMKIYIRLPWMLLGVSDPSSASVINDPKEYHTHPQRDELQIEKSDGFIFYPVIYNEKMLDFQPRLGDSFIKGTPYLWELWEEPSFQYRLKKSYSILAVYFKDL
jgi:hypothetical protein